MKIHFVAIGGSAMHNLAIALHKMDYEVSGSDDEIFEPSKGRLKKHGLLPKNIGWNEAKITSDLDAVILGMHARSDNPELIKAREMNIPVYSYPEYLYEVSKNKKRVVIGGSHGKTSITSMVLHVLKDQEMDFDYMVGAQLNGFETMVKISDAPIIVIEGDEYLSSPIDLRPKFHLYKPHIALISGIAWDHINVFPTFEYYVTQFKIFIDLIENGGTLIYFGEDERLKNLSENAKDGIEIIPYATPFFVIENGVTKLKYKNRKIPLKIFGNHNLQNLSGALEICKQLGVSEKDFYESIKKFAGADKRLELIAHKKNTRIFKDFAHSPSKLKATTAAVKEQFPENKLIACIELHTFSSLNKKFLSEYSGSLNDADEAIVYYNKHTIEHKKLPPLLEEDVKESFLPKKVRVFTDSKKLKKHLESESLENSTLLLMTSGNFDGIDLDEFAEELMKKIND